MKEKKQKGKGTNEAPFFIWSPKRQMYHISLPLRSLYLPFQTASKFHTHLSNKTKQKKSCYFMLSFPGAGLYLNRALQY